VRSRNKKYPFEVPLPDDAPVAGVVLADQVTSVDWRERRADRAGSLAPPLLEEIRARIRPLFGL
jgi:mRNA interferase MazF